MFTKTALFYDAIYSFKDYEAEAAKLHALIQQHKQSPGNSLLDVACGTGKHISLLKPDYDVEGLDLDENLLEIAKEHNPGVVFHQADMLDFSLGRQFDVITCLFGAVGYVRTPQNLRRALENMIRHLKPGGVLIVEPWIAPGNFQEGLLHALYADQPELKIARMNISRIEDGLAILDFHFMVGTPAGIDYFTERHEMGLFSREEYMSILEGNSLDVTYDPEGLMHRGLYTAVKRRAGEQAVQESALT